MEFEAFAGGDESELVAEAVCIRVMIAASVAAVLPTSMPVGKLCIHYCPAVTASYGISTAMVG